MDEYPSPNPNRPVSPAKLSRTPSWVMLGFVLGALFVWYLPSKDSRPPLRGAKTENTSAAATPAKKTVPKVAPAPRRFTDIEAVFAVYGQYAVWDSNRTEVALWNAEAKSYADFFEVLREGDALYFRSIPVLTRPILTHGTKNEIPLLFTETEEMRQRWIETRSQLVPGIATTPSTPATPPATAPTSEPSDAPAK